MKDWGLESLSLEIFSGTKVMLPPLDLAAYPGRTQGCRGLGGEVGVLGWGKAGLEDRGQGFGAS